MCNYLQKIFSTVQLFSKNILHCATICKKYSSMCNYLQTYKRESGNLHMKQRCYCEFNAERKMIRLRDQNMHEIKSQSIFTPQCNNTSAWNWTVNISAQNNPCTRLHCTSWLYSIVLKWVQQQNSREKVAFNFIELHNLYYRCTLLAWTWILSSAKGVLHCVTWVLHRVTWVLSRVQGEHYIVLHEC